VGTEGGGITESCGDKKHTTAKREQPSPPDYSDDSDGPDVARAPSPEEGGDSVGGQVSTARLGLAERGLVEEVDQRAQHRHADLGGERERRERGANARVQT